MTKKSQQPTEIADADLNDAQGGIVGGPLIGTATAHNLKELEAQDRLGNFEIQDLMSRFNQAETLASSLGFKSAEQTEQQARSDSGEAHLDYLTIDMEDVYAF